MELGHLQEYVSLVCMCFIYKLPATSPKHFSADREMFFSGVVATSADVCTLYKLHT